VVTAPARPYWHVSLLVGLFTLCTAAITEFQIGRLRMRRA
jgi:hypothetical protein